MNRASITQLRRASWQLQSLCAWLENPPKGTPISDWYINTCLDEVIKAIKSAQPEGDEIE